MKEYYCYIDEGGMFGDATVGVFEKKLPKQTKRQNIDDQQLTNFYFGFMPLHRFERYLLLFTKCFPSYLINVHPKSVEVDIPF